jgi:tRNA(fMet)-specific endonuclease VapC
MVFLPDTNIVSDLVHYPRGRIRNRIAELRGARICTSIIVAAEMRFGIARRKSPRLAAQLEAVLGGLEVCAFEPPADVFYGELRIELEAAGTPIGANNLLIAAQALALGCILVTDNLREFRGSDRSLSRAGCGERPSTQRNVYLVISDQT